MSGYDQAVTATFTLLRTFIEDDAMFAAEAIFGTIMIFHALAGAAELVSGKDSRLVSGPFWIRIMFIALLVAGFEKIFVNFGETLCRGCLNDLTTAWANVWSAWIAQIKLALHVQAGNAKSATSVFSLTEMVGTGLYDMIMDAIGVALAIVIGGLTMLYLLFQSFIALGSVAVVLALGPIALSFGAHESTQDIALAYTKTFLVYVVLYMPMLVLSFQIAMTLMLSVNTLTTNLSYAGVGDVLEHFINLVASPLAGAAIIAAVPHIVKGALK